MKIMGIDPGGTTGICIFDTESSVAELYQFPSSVLPLDSSDFGEIEERWCRETPYGKVYGHIWGLDVPMVRYGKWFEGEMEVAERCVDLAMERDVEKFVFEDFILRPGAGGGRDGISPCRIMSMMLTEIKGDWEASIGDCCVFQTAAEGKSVMTDARLGMKGYGMGHARDAYRHVIHFCRKKNLV